MAAPDRRSTGIDRRESGRSLYDNDNDDDDYDLAAMGISDGFRPADTEASHNRVNSHSSQYHERFQGRRTPPPRPSSTTKPKYDSFALRHDGATGPMPSRNSTNASSSSAVPVTRSSTVSTEMAFVRAESPYQGPTGPSHPYQMYPQESRVARTPSMATTSTVRVPERSYAGPSGPTHPYGMYPQSTVPAADDPDERTAIAPVPVGFPGRNNDYQRRLGPEGEEVADIIGPDGHTEQLPPYTQYPDEAFARKTRPTVQTTVAGAGGIGLATRNPEFASREDLTTPQSRHSTRSLMSESSGQVNPVAAVSEKRQLKKWQQIARRKVCGIIPIWAFVLVGAAFILFAIVLGTVLAILKPKHPKRHSYDDDTDDRPESIIITTMTTTYDARPFTVLPEGIQAIPTGTFRLPVTTPSVAPASCLVNSAQSSAWSCAIPPALPYEMTITNIPASDNLSNIEIRLDYGNASVEYLAYGAQPPILTEHKVMRLVEDSNYPERGPAWFFQAPYNKVVILPESALTASPSTLKRSGKSKRRTPSEFLGRKGVAQPGQMPWVCYWNGTLLEAFIYANQTSNTSKYPPPPPPSSSSSISAEQTPTSTTNTYPSASSSSPFPSSTSDSGKDEDPTFKPCYPKVVKLEERRLPIADQNIPPYCIQNVINADGSWQPLMDGNLPVTIYLNESIPAIAEPMAAFRTSHRSLHEQESSLATRQSNAMCGCVWLVQ